LQAYPEKERALWHLFERRTFEDGIALDNVATEQILDLLDYPEYFRLTRQPLPENRSSILEKLCADRLLQTGTGSRYAISNLGAILFARKLTDFGRLQHRGLRVVFFNGKDRTGSITEQVAGKLGYAIGFKRAIDWINARLPANEIIKGALRQEVRLYPELAIREIVANALIHQDFTISGTCPKVEIFEGRIEVSNPGVPLIEPNRFMDMQPKSRNPALASLMRRMGMCEELGTGIDKVVRSVEEFQLPPPDFRVSGENMLVILFAPRSFAEMDRDERVRACYQHACLQFVSGNKMSNASLRQRLGIKESNYPQASLIIKDAINNNLVKPNEEGAGANKTYVPFWA